MKEADRQKKIYEFGGRSVVFLIALIWGFNFISKNFDPVDSFLHYPNLVFHEAGHIIFSFLGDFMGTLGGSLLQIIMPITVMIHFLRLKNRFGASMGLWWVGQSLIDVAPYIGDAKEQKLMLLGGVTGKDAPGYHDWNNILSRFNLLDQAKLFGDIAYFVGALIILTALYWALNSLLQEWKNLKSSPS